MFLSLSVGELRLLMHKNEESECIGKIPNQCRESEEQIFWLRIKESVADPVVTEFKR